jgi:hypothetical protein
MISGEAATTVQCSLEEAFAFVTDFRQYAQADTKIGRVISVAQDGNLISVRFRPRIRGFFDIDQVDVRALATRLGLER